MFHSKNPKNHAQVDIPNISQQTLQLVNTKYPYNAEARLSELTDNWQTPIGKHFVRNHCAVPEIDPEDYTLTITGEGLTETTFSLEDLKTKFKKVDVTTVIQCNGNRREDFHFVDGMTSSFIIHPLS